ncbi:MAG: tripartite tricarboxylate transporter TctB family protein [Thermomicrobiales bacterium]
MNDDDRAEIISRLAELALAVGVTVLGAIVIWQTTEIRLTPINSRVGPRIIPYVIGTGLVVTGIWLFIDILRGRTAAVVGGEDSEDADPTLPTDWKTVGLISASLVAYLLLIERAGFVVASSVLFFGAAFAMGSRRYLRDALAGVLLSMFTFVLFTEGLSLRLPEGILPLDRLF